MISPISTVVFDCNDVATVSDFWAAATGYTKYAIDPDLAVLRHPEKVGPNLLFQQVPEPKTVKNRLHVELETTNLPTEVARLTSLGARKLQDVAENGSQWVVMADPEGNEFCVVLTQQKD